MALGSSLTGISFSGISSGIDTESIISRLLLLEQSPIQRLQAQQAQLTSKLGLMSAFRAKLGSLSSSIGSLSAASAFKSISISSSDNAVATATGNASSALGIYDLAVLKLAQSHKISSAGQASVSDPLGFSCDIVVNGHVIAVEAADTLKTLATKINGTGSGVAANVIDGGSGNAFLSLTSSRSGASGAIQIADVNGTVLSDLGILNGNESVQGSYGFSSATEPLGNLLGFTTGPAGSFQLNGVTINADFSTDSLQDVADAINSSGSGATAEVKSITVGGATKQQLVLTDVTSHSDDNGLLHSIGVIQNGYQSQLVAAQDAEYKLDGILLKSSTNTVENVIPGVTVTLKKAADGAGALTTLTVGQDTESIRKKIDDFVNQFNGLIDFVRTNTAFNKDSFDTGALFADPAVSRIEAAITDVLFTQLKGNDGLLSSLADIGIGLNSDGKLEVDEARLNGLLETNIDGISSVFRSTGITTVKQLEFIGGTSKTKPSGAAGYQVNITALAQKLSLGGIEAQAGPLAQQEVLSFSGAAFGGGSYEIVLSAGMTQAEVIDRINNDPKLKSLMTANVSGGKLQLDSKEFGTGAAFSVTSNVAAPNGGTGWGTGNILQAAANVAGTINGEPAIGSGQVLTGAGGNANTDGLQIRFTGNTLGNIGTVTYAQGVSDLMTGLVSGLTDSANGYLTNNDKGLQDQIDGIAKQITFRQDQLAAKKAILQARFNRMEQMIAELQAQQARIASFGQ